MDAANFYRLIGPTAWAGPPSSFSFSSLRQLEECPLRWQLSRSSYGDLSRFPRKPHPEATAGTIVHDALDRLFRALALQGLPGVGTPAFRSTVAAVDVMGTIRRSLAEQEDALASHPRAAGLRLRLADRQLYNEVCRLFQAEYARARPGAAAAASEPVSAPVRDGAADLLQLLEARGVLTEVPLRHPRLALGGTVDLIARAEGATRIVDFKTGAPKPAYREQLELYALLWFRQTGDLPRGLELRFPGGVEAFPVEHARLEALEREVNTRMDAARAALARPPAPARLGEHCRYCDVRQFCDAYWSSLPPIVVDRGKARLRAGWMDLEVWPHTDIADHGFVGRTAGGAELAVVFDHDGRAIHGPFEAGEQLRILGALVPEDGTEVRLQRSTEVFHCPAAGAPSKSAGS